MDGVKIVFFAIFDQFLEFIKNNFHFQSLRKIEAVLLPSM